LQGIALLGSTGSIGRSTLDVVARHPGRFKVVSLAAKGSNPELLRRQALEFGAGLIACEQVGPADILRSDKQLSHVRIVHGPKAASRAALAENVDLVVAAMSGTAGLIPVFEAAKAGKNLALANKEALVLGGPLLLTEAAKAGGEVRPIDSEHSALFQVMGGREPIGVKRLFLTASGGPFRNMTLDDLAAVTPEQALRHPVWNMGRKVTIDSATLMNKGLEVIEARWLFNLPGDDISVLVHPEGVVHGMVQYKDGAIVAQLGNPDMKLPIAYALSCPERLELDLQPLDLTSLGGLTFQEPDVGRFPCLSLARRALSKGQAAVAALCAADEVAVDAFLSGRLEFLRIAWLVEQVLNDAPSGNPSSLDQVIDLLAEARVRAEDLLARKGRSERDGE